MDLNYSGEKYFLRFGSYPYVTHLVSNDTLNIKTINIDKSLFNQIFSVMFPFNFFIR